MDSNFDENKNLSNDVNFDSKNIVRRDNKELFTRVEGAETRAKKAAEERARVERAKRRFAKRAENDTKRRARKIASAQRRAHLKAVLWEGKHKKRTLIIAGAILLALIAYPAYLGGSALISAIVSSIETAQKEKEIKELNEIPANYANIVFGELLEKYKKGGFEEGEKYFQESYDKVDTDELRSALLSMHVNALTSIYNKEHLDLAIEEALRAEEISESSYTATVLMNLYQQKGDNRNYKKYEDLYMSRVDTSTGGKG